MIVIDRVIQMFIQVEMNKKIKWSACKERKKPFRQDVPFISCTSGTIDEYNTLISHSLNYDGKHYSFGNGVYHRYDKKNS